MNRPPPAPPAPWLVHLFATRTTRSTLRRCVSVVVLHAHQAHRGWCVCQKRDHAEHLHELNNDRQQRLWHDVADVCAPSPRSPGCRRINYENLGNVVNHVHWHVIPRRCRAPTDPDPGRDGVGATGRRRWSAEWRMMCGMGLVERIAAALGSHYHPA